MQLHITPQLLETPVAGPHRDGYFYCQAPKISDREFDSKGGLSHNLCEPPGISALGIGRDFKPLHPSFLSYKETAGLDPLSFDGSVCVLRRVRLCNPVGCSPPDSSVRAIFQARILEWVAISSPRGSSQPGD